MPIVWEAVGASALANIGAILTGFTTRKEIKTWYPALKLPQWTPPNYVFGPVWTGLYTGMGYASYLVWRDGGGFEEAKLPLTLYGSQLLLNWAWSPIFFGKHDLRMAFYEICALWVNAGVCGVYFYKVNQVAGYFFVPYMLWLSLATALTYRIYKDNPKEIEPAKTD